MNAPGAGACYLPLAYAVGGPAAGALRACHEALQSCPGYGELAAKAGLTGGPRVRTLVREQASAEGALALKRLYVSFQQGGAAEGLPFQADTFLYDFGMGRLRHWAFPDDPRLPELRPLLAPWRSAGVLRYVPLKRLTLWLDDGPQGGPVVGKVGADLDTRALSAQQSAISAAARAAGAGFRVAQPLTAPESPGLALQEALAGRELAHSLTVSNLRESLAAAGEIHAAIHGLAVSDTPSWRFGSYRELLAERIRWIRWMRPDHAQFLDMVHSALGAAADALAQDGPVFCHGDFRCTQILFDPDRGDWSVVDFDGCAMGDRHYEVGKFLALLEYDLPWLRGGAGQALALAEDAYLGAYVAKSGCRLDGLALAWHRTAAELFFLARMLKRDLLDPSAFDTTVRRISLRWRIEGREKEGKIAP